MKIADLQIYSRERQQSDRVDALRGSDTLLASRCDQSKRSSRLLTRIFCDESRGNHPGNISLGSPPFASASENAGNRQSGFDRRIGVRLVTDFVTAAECPRDVRGRRSLAAIQTAN